MGTGVPAAGNRIPDGREQEYRRPGAGVPAAPINDLQRVTEDDHIANVREMFVPLHHPIIGDMKVNGNPVKLLDTKADISRPAPALGQDNGEVYKSLLGFDESFLEKLKEDKII